MINYPPFLGKGLAFPFRLSAKGGAEMTVGKTDNLPIGLEYLQERFTIDQPVSVSANHVAEAIGHILLTHPGERDWLPEFGSKVDYILFDPNLVYTQQEFETWLELSTIRWEKRAFIQVPDGVMWKNDPDGIDKGHLSAKIDPTIIPRQSEGNMVAPMASPRDTRSLEYPLGNSDSAGHDWLSRYKNSTVYEENGESYLRPRFDMPIAYAVDDTYYETKQLDTWLSISYKFYGDIRLSWVISDCYVQDAAKEGLSRQVIDTTGDPDPGIFLRIPSRARVLTEIVK